MWIVVLSFVLSFYTFSGIYFAAIVPLAVCLISKKNWYSLVCFATSILTGFLFTDERIVLSLLSSIAIVYLSLILFKGFDWNLKTKLSTVATISTIGLLLTQPNLLNLNWAISVALYPVFIYFITYNLLFILEDLDFKENISITSKQLGFFSVLINLLIGGLSFFKDEPNTMLFSLLAFNILLIRVDKNAGLVSVLTSFIINVTNKISVALIAISPIIFLFKKTLKNKPTMSMAFFTFCLSLVVISRKYTFIDDLCVLTIIYFFTSNNFVYQIQKTIINPKDYKLKMYQENYYNSLNKSRKIQKVLAVLEGYLKSYSNDDNSKDIIKKSMQFLSDIQKEDEQTDLKEKILNELKNKGIDLLGFRLYSDYFFNYQLYLKINRDEDEEKMIKVIEENLKIRLKVNSCYENKFVNTKEYYLDNYQRYNLNLEIKQRSKELNFCGDSYLSFYLKNKKYFLISDGMGHGKEANKESSFALFLLKEFIELGMDAISAIVFCNNIICIEKKESFNTLDLIEYDSYTNEMFLYKNGSGDTYLKHDEKVEKINSENLPLGIVENISVKKLKLPEIYDTVILTSDGFKKDLTQIISKQNKSKKIIEDAFCYEGNKIDDDQTIMVISVIKK